MTLNYYDYSGYKKYWHTPLFSNEMFFFYRILPSLFIVSNVFYHMKALANCIKYLDLINYYAHPIINVMAHQYFLLLSCICIFLKFLFLNDCENVYKNYKIFSTSIYFAEIAKVFKKANIPNINKSHHSVWLSSILIICLKWLFMLYTNFLLNISSQYIYILQLLYFQIGFKYHQYDHRSIAPRYNANEISNCFI